jgi:flagellar protein FlbD
VILVHRLRGEPLLLNADLIESVESTPDTMITLVDGRHLVVAETAEEIAERVCEFRAAVLAAAEGARSRRTNVVSFPTGDG